MHDSPAPLSAPVAVGFLRLEGLVLFVAALVAYGWVSGAWARGALLLLLPDLAMILYAFGPRIGALGYNILHSYPLPALLLAFGLRGSETLLSLALIWFAHVGLDRALGYGLKAPEAFRVTHLGRIGRGGSHPRGARGA